MTPTQSAYRVGRTIGHAYGYAEGYHAAARLWTAKMEAFEAAHHAQLARSEIPRLHPYAPERPTPRPPREDEYHGGPVTWD